MSSRWLLAGTSLVALSFVVPGALAAQVRASEHALVAQTMAGTTLTIEYSRPAARGRPRLFGGVVRWGEVWTPGANWATTLEVDRDIHLQGNAVPRGKYSMWMIPREAEDWTVFLSEKNRLFHTQKPNPKDALVSFTVKPEQATAAAEVLTWSFPLVTREGGELHMQWGSTSITLKVGVNAALPMAPAGFDLQPYPGTYKMTFEPEEPGQKPFEVNVEVTQRDGRLLGRFADSPPGFDPEFQLLPVRTHTFQALYFKDGKPYDQDAESEIVFQVQDGRAVRFEMTFEKAVYARGTRLK